MQEKNKKRRERKKKLEEEFRAVTKISSCWINTTSRQGIKQLGFSFGFLFSYENSQGPRS